MAKCCKVYLQIHARMTSQTTLYPIHGMYMAFRKLVYMCLLLIGTL